MGHGASLFDGRLNWKRLIRLFLLLDIALLILIVAALWRSDDPNVKYVLYIPSPTATGTATPTLTPGPTATPTPWPTSTATPFNPTATATPVVTLRVQNPTATAQAQVQATLQADEVATAMAHLRAITQQRREQRFRSAQPLSFSRENRLVLAHYFAWYDGDGWNDCNISAGDKPVQPYDSNDPVAIAKHIQLAQAIGLNGFTLHWFAPGDRTDQNFNTLLNQAYGTNFAATVVFSHHIWHGLSRPTSQNISEALTYLMTQYSQHPNFLRVDGQPVIFFTDIYRAPANALQFWASVRDQVDPARQTLWIAEGLDPAYLNVFDGLYVFKISHADYPHDYEKSSRWAGWVRASEAQTGQPKLWIATISPGWDDLRSDCKPDVRVDNRPHRLDRANGAIYQATFQAALASNPDWLILSSFNEWVEGSYIEPSEQYGDTYLQLTGDFVRQFQTQ
jgi:hypothetical protein